MLNSRNKLPTSLKDCYLNDRVSDNLWSWSERLEIWGARILIYLIIVGIISTIGDVIEIADINEDMVFITVIMSIVRWGLYAFLTYCSYNVLSLLIASLATIVQSTKITANIALYKHSEIFL